MKNTLIVLLISLAFVSILSIVAACGLYFINGLWLSNFLISFVLISFFGFISNSFIDKRTSIIIENIKLEREKLISEQSVEVLCAYCKVKNTTQVKLGDQNRFNCKSCNQVNSIIFQFGTVQISTPLVLPEFSNISNEMLNKITTATQEQE